MKHRIIEIDDNSVYVMNIPAYADEGTLSTQGAVILRLHDKIIAQAQYIEDNGLAPYQTPKQIAKGTLNEDEMRAKKLLNRKYD